MSWLDELLDDLHSGDFSPDYSRLATRYGLSLTTLREQFKAATGTTMHDYVLQNRMVAARTLLHETDLPLKAIADQLGYNDVFYFSRQFRRFVGVTPGGYRQSRQR